MNEVISQRDLHDGPRALRNLDEPWRIGPLQLVQPHPVHRDHLVGRGPGIEPSAALGLAAEGRRTIIFPTRMNLKLLAESPDSASATTAALARPGVVVTPWVERRETGQVLVIPPDAGYGAVEEDLASVGT